MVDPVSLSYHFSASNAFPPESRTLELSTPDFASANLFVHVIDANDEDRFVLLMAVPVGSFLEVASANVPERFLSFAVEGVEDMGGWVTFVGVASNWGEMFEGGELLDVLVPVPEPPPEPTGATLIEVVGAMASALDPLKLTIPDLQVYPFLNYNPTPPSIDIYPADLFQTGSGFRDDSDVFFTVRARTTTADHEAGQKALLRMLDRHAPESVEEALTLDQTLGGRVHSTGIAEDGVSGYREYLEDPQANGRLIGCEWRVHVITKGDG
jgi:hypothetical protein